MKKKKSILIYMLTISIILYILIIVYKLSKTYRFIHVYEMFEFVIFLFLSLLPIFLVSLLLAATLKINENDIIVMGKKKNIKKIFAIVIYPLILIPYYDVMYLLLCGTLCSSTQSLSNYLVVDKKIDGAGSGVFPSNVSDCKNPYYKYVFSTSIIDYEYMIYLQCTLSQKKYEEEKRRIEQFQNSIVYNDYNTTKYLIRYGTTITFYEKEKKVSYLIEIK